MLGSHSRIQWVEDGRRAKQALNWIPAGTREISGTRVSWNDNIAKDIENSGVTWEEEEALML